METAIVSGAEGMAHPDSRRPGAIDLWAPEETISNQGGIGAIVFQGEQSTAQDTDKKNHQSADERMLGNYQTAAFI